jgi:hypothetical protein
MISSISINELAARVLVLEKEETRRIPRELDVEQRLRRIERTIYAASGALAALQFILKLWTPHL